jgi:hypothetical protein
MLWASYFVTFMMLVNSAARTPTLLQRAGINGAQSSVAIALPDTKPPAGGACRSPMQVFS